MANFDPSDPLDLCIYNIYTTYPHLALTIERLNDILMRRIKNASEDMTKEQAICKYQDQLFKSLEEQKRQMAL